MGRSWEDGDSLRLGFRQVEGQALWQTLGLEISEQGAGGLMAELEGSCGVHLTVRSQEEGS